jgi:signal transduction histidine kinase
MKIKYFILILMSLLTIISSLIFTFVIYDTNSKALLKGLDDKLVTASNFTRALAGEDFHDNIIDENSVSKEDYIKIVDTYNKLCAELGLEYVWSLLVIDDKTVFTSGTSTSKDITKGDYAPFFKQHDNPELYTETFKTMTPSFQINDDKWGRIRVVLVPFKDKLGRPYLFGASVKTTAVDEMVQKTLAKSIFIGAAIVILGVFFSLAVARQISKPIEEVTVIARLIADGKLEQKSSERGSFETKSLANSINAMSNSIKIQIDQLLGTEQQLRASNQQLIASEQQLKASEQQLKANNQQLTASDQQLRASNQQLEAREREQKKLLKAISIKNKELESIVYISSHDLRSPLVNIQGFSGELGTSCETLLSLMGNESEPSSRDEMETILKDEIPESLGFIASSTLKMKTLLDALLQMSRVGASEPEMTSVNMNELIEDIRGTIGFQIKQNDASLVVEELPNCIADAKLLNQVFTNLIDNALKYREPSRKTVIEISGQIKDGLAVYCVKDNGMGIKKDYQKKIFEVFHRLNPESDIDGEGIGLAIVSRIIERMDGEIRVESEADTGTEFFISLPVT